MLRPVLGSLTFLAVLLMLAAGPLTAQDKGGKKVHHECVIVKVDPKNHTIVVDFRDKKKPKPYKLVESVKIIDKHGHLIKIDIFKKGDHVKIVESDGWVHELHHKHYDRKKTGGKQPTK